MCSDDSAVKTGITNINTSSENSRLTGRDLPDKLSPACSMCLLLHHSKKDSGVACYCLRDPPKVLWGAAGRGPLGREGWVHSPAVTLEGGADSGGLPSVQGPVQQDNAGPLFAKASESPEGDSRGSNQALPCRGSGRGWGWGGGGVHGQELQGMPRPRWGRGRGGA